MSSFRTITTKLVVGSLTMLAGSSVVNQQASGGVVSPPDLQFYMQVNNDDAIHFYPEGNPDGPNTWNWNGAYDLPDWDMTFDITGDTDPFVQSVIGFTNSSAVTNTYTITVLLPAIPVAGPNLIGGSVGGSVTDANNDGVATVGYGSGPGTSLFTGIIDGGLVLGAPPIGSQLHLNPFSTSAPFAGGTANIPAISFGLPGPTQVNGIPVTANIGIQLQFTLTAGDSVAITSFFIVEPIPAPGALALIGLAGLSVRRRRR